MTNEKNRSFHHLIPYLGLAVGIVIFIQVFFRAELPVIVAYALLPLSLLIFLTLLKSPYLALMLVFFVNYFIMGVTRYVPGLMGGVLIDAMLGLVILGLIITSFVKTWHFEYLKNGLTLVILVWFLFCFLNLLNPEAPFAAWIIGIRRTALYFFIFPVLTFLLFRQYRDMKVIIFIWSVFVILAILKALVQKYTGFDAAEMRWLYIEGKAKTHIIYSGIRYFSFFTDAANFGCGMALAMVFFSISALFVENKTVKVYFLIVSVLAAYGMLISGTRVAIAIPFVGYSLFALISKNVRMIAGGSLLLLGAFIILNFTNYGQGNNYIRRVRTAFHPEQDASFIVRLENQKIMRAYLADHPMGVGIGTAKASEYSNAEISKIPTDSWLVMVWVETGITGLILYLLIILYIFIKGIHLLMFKIHNKELWGYECAFLAGIAGMFVASYANEVIAQFPNGPIIYMTMAFIFMAETYDRQLNEQNAAKISILGEKN